jgi:hypothetical protein
VIFPGNDRGHRRDWEAGLLGLALLPIWSAGVVAQVSPSEASPGRVQFVHEAWGIDDGLPINEVNDLVQTSDGYLWLATFDGLVRFDGVRFTVYNIANSPGLPSNRIVDLFEARDGGLWLRTEDNLPVRFKDERFKVYRGRTADEFRGVLLWGRVGGNDAARVLPGRGQSHPDSRTRNWTHGERAPARPIR